LDQGSQELEFLDDSQLNKEANRTERGRGMIGAESGNQTKEAESGRNMERIWRRGIRRNTCRGRIWEEEVEVGGKS
jgi:hypothetical protein